MAGKRRWLWITLFVLVILILGSLTTGWNVTLFSEYERLAEFARRFSLRETDLAISRPWLGVTLGTLGFVAATAGLVIFFVRLLKEMRLNQVQSEFLASVSHSLKTPIATLELSSTLLRTGDLSKEESDRLWESHGAELKRLKDQVHSLLEAARIQSFSSDGSGARRSFVVLETWLSESLVRWRQMLGPQARIDREGAPLDCEAYVDVKMLDLIADNFLDNARKFANGNPVVTLSTEVTPKYWLLKITDAGWGFEPQDSERLFNRFFRSKSAAPYAIPGTGLGLYLASSAAKAMGLELKAESRGRGKGATFSIQGPRVQA